METGKRLTTFEEFEAFWRGKNPRQFISTGRCWVIWQLCRHTELLPGDIVEVGVYQGSSAIVLANAASRSDRQDTLHLFDTFTGMPETLPVDLHVKGDFKDTSLESVQQYLKDYPAIKFNPGLFQDNLDNLPAMIRFAHLDGDLYSTTKAGLEAIWPRMPVGGVIVLDDYLDSHCPGCTQATQEFCERYHIKAIHIWQGMIIKT